MLYEEDPITVGTDCGPVLGKLVLSQMTGSSYFSFQGIPYAEPPVGPLRFKPPVPKEPWSDVRDCREEGAPCPHYHLWKKHYCGDEDCLFLNVYSPKLPSISTRSLPVMVYIHGGIYGTGSGGTDLCGPDFIVDEGTVLVTMNYRLGIFGNGVVGFLNLEEPGDAQGNMGLKDQVAAMKWVKRNIANFGGDRNNVTIAGESAGAASVQFHMMSPMSKGLFDRVISQSGSVFNPWSWTNKSRERAFRLGRNLGCNTDDSHTLLQFLRDIPAKTLVESFPKAFSEQDREYHCCLSPFPFLPSVEKSDGSVEAFLTIDPSVMLHQGQFFKGPFLGGVNSNEGLLAFGAFRGMNETDMLEKFNKRFSKLLPWRMNLRRGSSAEKRVADFIQAYFLKSKPVTKETISSYITLLGDLMIYHGFHEFVKFFRRSASPYLYQFSYDGEANKFKKDVGAGAHPGASHGDELLYLFQTGLSPEWDPMDHDSADVLTRRRVVRMWTNFVKTGNPTPKHDNLLGVTWLPSMDDQPSFLEISSTLHVRPGVMFEDRMAFWDSLTGNASKL